MGEPLVCPWGDIVGVTANGSYVFQPYVATPTVPGDADFQSGSLDPVLAVSGMVRLEFDFRWDRYVATGPFGKRAFSAPWSRRTAVAVTESPPTAAIYDRGSQAQLLVRDLRRNRVRTVTLAIPPAARFQRPEIHLDGGSRAYYLADEASLRTRPTKVPVLRERERAVDEVDYVRYLVEADLANGSCRVLARVETPGDDPQSLIAFDGSPKQGGNDLVVMTRFLVVRANDRIFILSR